ncbi:PREDICTED: septum-promoting GTP-binding protein 1-like isoform X2 [Nicotiana attenuata]|uniref:Ras-related protein rabh1b n=1 Tax=Nicotiana attenuata TaxID=49451 RepID=A0A314KP28_NICAT|nr:PREDICTED: septum-promoting GTP-binding protein 1-like isoform X2 [Nicotiana attenuata]OIT31078.1 ras-related protein rabh1b [Nicotiana attenuata]
MVKHLLLCYRRMFKLNKKRKIICKVSILQKYVKSLWNQIVGCCIGKSIKYRKLSRQHSSSTTTTAAPPSSPSGGAVPDGGFNGKCYCDHSKESLEDLVALKICLLGDNQIGKTSFMTKYVGKEKGEESFSTTGLNQMDKILCVKGARISYSIWEVQGDVSASTQIPIACKDSVAMLFMFDLTSRCTLKSVISWYQQARQWNQTAIPVMIGTKFDDFVQLPLDMQWTIASQARAYAKALNATLFFSSATYNINVNKIFKFITAKLFNLPWTLERNLTIGEPIIDF